MTSEEHSQSVPPHETIEIRLHVKIKTTDRSEKSKENSSWVKRESPKRAKKWSGRRPITF